MDEWVEMFTDGACRGNPGPGGWGVLLRFRGAEKRLHGGVSDTTNNRMELTAVIKGLQALKRSSKVRVSTDSRYVQQGITDWIRRWKANGWKTAGRQPVKNADLWRKLDELVVTHEVKWRWIKGHSGHPDNEQADALARRGLTERTRV